MKTKAPKLTFSYPSWIFPGSLAIGPYYPTPCVELSDFPSKNSFYITFGCLMEPEVSYSVDVNVYLNEVALIDDNRTSDTQFLYSVITEEGEYVSINIMLLDDIIFPEPGIYKVVVTMYSGTVEENTNELVDTSESYLVVTRQIRPLKDGPNGK